MRIALVTRRYPPECCGVGDYTSRLAESWARQGHEVIVFVASSVGDEKRPLDCAQGKPTTIGRRPVETVRVERIKLDGWRDVRGAAEAIREARPDAVQLEYSNYGWSRWGFAFWMNHFLRELRRGGSDGKMPVTVAMHEFPLTFAQAPLLAGVSLLQRLHFALLVLGASEVLTNTRERVRILRRWFPWRRETIRYRPNSGHIPVAGYDAGKIAALRAIHAPAGALVVTTFGTYHSYKNFEAVIAAAGELQRERPVALWLLGDTSPTQPAYLELLRGRIRERGLDDAAWWPGRMEPAEISVCLQATDVFVLPQPDGHLTRSSTFMSAAEHGLAVIAARNPENQAEFTHGENVWLAEESRTDLFAQALRELAGDVTLRARLGSNLRALYEREFAWEVAARPQLTSEREAEAVRVIE